MKVVDVSQRSDAWRVWRSQGIGASEAAVIMGRSPYKTPWRWWAEKTGLVLEQPQDNNPLILKNSVELNPTENIQHKFDKPTGGMI